MTTTRTRALVLGTLAVIGLGAALFVYLRRDAAPLAFQGWVEAYFVFVSADESGRIEALIRTSVSPIMEQLGKVAAAPDLPPLKAIEAFFALFEKEVLGTERKLLLRLIIAEGGRFPAIAEMYYREVVACGIGLMRTLAERAAQQGVFATSAAARYPQLIVAPLILAVIWDGLFAKIDPLDVGGLLRAHRDLLAGKPRKGAS